MSEETLEGESRFEIIAIEMPDAILRGMLCDWTAASTITARQAEANRRLAETVGRSLDVTARDWEEEAPPLGVLRDNKLNLILVEALLANDLPLRLLNRTRVPECISNINRRLGENTSDLAAVGISINASDTRGITAASCMP